MNTDGTKVDQWILQGELPKSVLSAIPSHLHPFALLADPSVDKHRDDALHELHALQALVDLSHHSLGPDAISESVRSEMMQWYAAQSGTVPLGATVSPLSSSSPLSQLVAVATEVIAEMKQDLSRNAFQLLALNPTRRDQLLQLFRRLCPVSTPSSTHALDPHLTDDLRQWVEGPRNSAQETAFQTYVGQVATLYFAQAVLLKTWSDRNIRPWSQSDLKQINWALSSSLRTKLPSHRDGWHVTKPNLYSWYSPSAKIQEQIWNRLSQLSMLREGPALMLTLLKKTPKGFDHRFFQSLWDRTKQLGFQNIARQRYLFTPTLRDGSLIQAMPETLVSPNTTWLAMEDNGYELLVAELGLLWWGPTAPPLWAQGTGLEVHSKEQLTLNWSSPKPSTLQALSEIESCVLAFVMEEHAVRLNQRKQDAFAFKNACDRLPYFKTLRGPETSLGALQACVALGKLRPGGILWWGRNERLGPKEGAEVLKFLFGKGLLIAEWDWTGVEHALPMSSSLFPPYLYLFMRESDFSKRDTHEPARIRVEGQLRSHVEVSLILEDGLRSWTESLDGGKGRGSWKTHVFSSAGSQQQWLEVWPDSTSPETVRKLDTMREAGRPLGQVATVRASGDKDGNLFSPFGHHLIGVTAGITKFGSYGINVSAQARPSDFLIAVNEAHGLPPIAVYLSSPWVHDWLSFHAERKKDKLIFKEQTLKFIPISKRLLETLATHKGSESGAGTIDPILLTDPVRWPRLAERFEQTTSAPVFAQLAYALWHFEKELSKTAPMLHAQSPGSVRWSKILELIPQRDKVPFSQHPGVRLTGVMPPHVPIHHFERVRSPAQGILFATESGMTTHLWSEQNILLEMILEQTSKDCVTWAELVDTVQLPRKLDQARLTAQEIIRCHEGMVVRRDFVQKMAFECRLF